MTRRLLHVSIFALLAVALPAHGGQFRSPRTPAGPYPAPPRPVTPAGSGPLTRTAVTAPTTRWNLWWEFRKDAYLNLREAVHTATTVTGSDEFFMGGSRIVAAVDTIMPAESDVTHIILPALKRALDGSDQRDIVSSCLVAMAKIGRDHPDFSILDCMRPHLRSKDQEVRETAALAMGISQMTAAVPDLVALAKGDARGRELCRRSSVDYRTRSFACYALGLIAHATEKHYYKLRCFAALRTVLEETTENVVDRNVPIAAIHGIRLLDPGTEGQGMQLRRDALAVLWSYYQRDIGPGEEVVQAHVPTAIATLAPGDAQADRYKLTFLRDLQGRTERTSNAIAQSAAMALGLMCEAPETRPEDAPFSEAVRDYARAGKNEVARYLSWIALGEIGGDGNRDALLVALAKANGLARPWIALGLGVHGARHLQRHPAGRPDRTVGEALVAELGKTKNEHSLAAVSVALGMGRHTDTAEQLEALLIRHRHRDQLAGYVCIGLALMDVPRGLPVIREIVESSARRPDLLQQSAVALGRLGDKTATDLLLRMLGDPNKSLARLSSIAGALTLIGDRRTIQPLVAMLEDQDLTPLTRAFAAVALGGVADKEPLPWNAKIGAGVNYRATVETLTNGVSGVLDIL